MKNIIGALLLTLFYFYDTIKALSKKLFNFLKK